MRSPGIAVTGIGLVTAGGVGREATWRRVCSGAGTAASSSELRGLPVEFCCTVPPFGTALDPSRRKAWRLDRCARIALIAAREAVTDARLDPAAWDATRVGVVLGSIFGGAGTLWEQQSRLRDRGPEHVSALMHPMSMTNTAAGETAMDLGIQGPSLAVTTACAAGADALVIARAWLAGGLCDVVLAGGAEAAGTPMNVVGFHRLGVLSTRQDDPASASRPFDADRDGFVIGEAAAVLVLERTDDARSRGMSARAVLAGCGSTSDAHHPTSPHPRGSGARRALRQALKEAGVSPGEVGHVNAHGTGTPLNDAVEAAVISECLPHGPSVTATKGVLGHTLGAAGAVEAAVTVLTLQHGLVPPTANLRRTDPDVSLDLVKGVPRAQHIDVAVSNSFGFGGHNAVLVFRKP